MVITKLEDVTKQGFCKILCRKLRLRGSLLLVLILFFGWEVKGGGVEVGGYLWSAICFKIMTRYRCGFFPTYTCNHSCYTIYLRFFCHLYMPSFLLSGVFIPKYMTIFL